MSEYEVHAIVQRLNELQANVARLERVLAATSQAGWQAASGNGGGGGSAVVAKLTSSLGPASGATYGTGTGVYELDNGTTLSDDVTTLSLKNLLNKTGASGARVVAVPTGDGSLWVVAIDDCNNLS